MIGDRTDTPKTIYGTAIGLFDGKEVYLSRRIDTPLYPKKWQFVNARLKASEQSQAGAIRVVEDQTGIQLTNDRLCYVHAITIADTNEFYYVYLVHLRPGEKPINSDTKYRSEWKKFKLENAVVLDLVPGVRTILRKLLRCLIKVEEMEKNQATGQNAFLDIKAEADAIYDEQRKREEEAEEAARQSGPGATWENNNGAWDALSELGGC
jgi:ADP-ribose pyrophosphatase YjhB (NUDIX family)